MGVIASSPGGRLVLKRQEREEKAVRYEPDVTIPAKQVTMVNVSEGALRRRQAQPAYTG